MLTLARLSEAHAIDGDFPKGAVSAVIDDATFGLPIADVIDVVAEKARLEKEISKLNKELARFDGKLNNEKFLANAPAEVVEAEREKRAEAELAKEKLEDAVGKLDAI